MRALAPSAVLARRTAFALLCATVSACARTPPASVPAIGSGSTAGSSASETRPSATATREPVARAPARATEPDVAPPEVARSESVECHLDPSACGPSKRLAPSHEPAPQDDLPETLGIEKIRRGFDVVEPQIHECARTFGVTAKQRILVELAVAGSSGMVTRAKVARPTLAAGLEQCIVAAAHRAKFPRFRKQKTSAVLRVDLP